MIKSGFITIIGRPNSGKSTLINKLVNFRVAITSPKVQTTRDEIHGIYNDEDSQMIFIDTPGIHKPKHMLGEKMNKTSFKTIKDVDLILYLIDTTKKINEDNDLIHLQLKKSNIPIFLLLTKIDQTDKAHVFSLIEQYKNILDFKQIIPISSLRGYNIDSLIQEIKNILPLGPRYYDLESISNRSQDFIIKELIRERIIYLTQEEIPHSVAVIIEKLKDNPKNIEIDAIIIVERESQKGIIIGSNGKLIKEIGVQSRHNIQDLVRKKVILKLYVKVESGWRNNPKYLNYLGYEEK